MEPQTSLLFRQYVLNERVLKKRTAFRRVSAAYTSTSDAFRFVAITRLTVLPVTGDSPEAMISPFAAFKRQRYGG
jgi:hypothetical protein